MKEIIENQQLLDILQQNNVTFAALFGSQAKGTAGVKSDYDFLIDTDPDVSFSLFDHIALRDQLGSALNAKVDLVTLGGLNRHMRDSVIKNMEIIYDERKR